MNPLDIEKAAAKRAIDFTAEHARERYITLGRGQTLVYLEKAEEAADYIAAGYPNSEKGYPYVYSEAKATGKTPKAVADGIIEAKGRWQHTSAQIEEIRLKGKAQITESSATKEIQRIRTETILMLKDL